MENGIKNPVGKSGRILSLDAFRGITIAAMILVNNPGQWGHQYPWLKHARGNGGTPTDWIFPFFVFITGVAIALALSKRKESGADQGQLLMKIFSRSLVIFLLGLLFYLFPYFDFANMRIPGVLQRIAVVYFVCSLIFLKASWKTQAWLMTGTLFLYWFIMTVIPVPGVGAANLEPATNLGAWLDRLLMQGHLWNPMDDPDGLLSTLPAIATGLSGVLTGIWIRRKMDPALKVVWMFVFGCVGLTAGLIWDPLFPLNKNLWTSSFVCYTSGLALIGFALFYWFADVLGYKKWTKPFVAYGMNAISIYMVSHMSASVIGGVIKIPVAGGDSISLHGWIYNNLMLSWLDPANASLLWSVLYILIWLPPLWYMMKKNIIIKV